jgi:phosphonate transport system permease protein
MRSLPIARVIYAAITVAAFISLYRMELLNPQVLWPAAERLWEFATSLVPPELDVLRTLLGAMGETLEIAFVGTLLGFVLALPLALVATHTLFPPVVTAAVRLLFGAVRTIPSLLWAVIFVIGFGLGPAAGALGVAMYSVGYLGKLFYEAFDAVDAEVLEALRGTARNRIQLAVYAVLPESANAVLSQLFFMFEYNIRASAIMGFVGAGGIGFYILGYIQLLQYQQLLTALLVTFVVVMGVDFLSARVRALVLAPAGPAGPLPTDRLTATALSSS